MGRSPDCRAPEHLPIQPWMRSRTLLTQVLAVNAVLVAVTAFVAAVVARERFSGAASGRGLAILALAVLAVILLNSLLLRRRLEPLNRVLYVLEEVELASPGHRATAPRQAAKEM